GYLLYISSYPYWQSKFSELWRHCLGRLTANDKSFVPRQEWKTVIWEARFMAAFYAIVILVTALFQFWEVLWFWFLPVVLGEPVMRAIRMTEHVGRPTVTDMKTNTRSNRVALPWRFLCWNMNYHAEHHYASSVPFHALPALSEKLEGYIYTEKQGYFGAHVDIVSQLIGKSPRSDSA
ncbi:MAG: fatty acid desaturase, partial [bacterium]